MIELLSNKSKRTKIHLFQDAEAGSELRRARSGSVPETRDKEVEISVNSNFVTNISIGRISPPDLSPFMKRKIQLEIEERRLSDVKTPIKCDKHACNSSHICSFVSPRRTRACLRNVPYKYSYSYSPFYLRPSVAPLSGVLSSSSSKSGGRLRWVFARKNIVKLSLSPSIYISISHVSLISTQKE